MRDEMDGRIWVAHHQALSDNFDKFIPAVRDALARLHAIHFAAPWREGRRGQSAG